MPADVHSVAKAPGPDYSVITPQQPLLPSLPASLANSRSAGSRWVQQMKRRARILATVRELVIEEGYQNFAICRLAERSGVTPPTIYNLIGGRKEVLHRAVDEKHSAKVQFAREWAAAENINPILAYADTLWIALSHDPGYSREAVRAMILLDRELSSLIRRRAEAAILAWLVALREAGRLRRSVDLRAIAECAHRHIVTAVGSWAENDMDTAELRRQLGLGLGLMLLGMTDKAESDRIEAWLARIGSELSN